MIPKGSNPGYSYLTIKAESRGFFKEKASKFLAFAYPVASEEEAKSKLEALKKEYFDARHHCFAWMLGAAKSRFRASDDGEPHHSAGDPILGQIRSRNLTNVIVVVVRYFGGTKLGVGGLVTAYKTATEEALKNATIIECEVRQKLTLTYSYSSTPEVMKLVKDFELEVLSQQFDEQGRMEVEVKERVRKELLDKINLLQALGSTLQIS